MAITPVSPPFPLLFDYLLASSWTWLAIFLATIATTLRALRVRLPRRHHHHLDPSGQPPSAIAISSSPPSSSSEAESSLFCSGRTEKPSSFPPISLQRSMRRRARSKSTSALEKLHRNGEGFLRTGMELLSSVLDADFSPSLKKITSATKLFNGNSPCENMHQRLGKGTFAAHTSFENGKEDLWSAANVGFSADEFLGLGFDKETLVQENEAHCHSSVKEGLMQTDEDASSSHHWLPSWAYSLCDPLQNTFSYPSPFADTFVDDFSAFQVSPCFEKQFGWDKVLESKLGLSWNFPSAVVSGPAQRSECTMETPNVVKTWTGQQKKLLKTLRVDTVSTLALDVHAQGGLACTGSIAGEVSVWELGRMKASSMAFEKPILALSMNSEQGATIVGSSNGLGFWDQRSSLRQPLGFASSTSQRKAHVSALKSRGNGLCVADNDSFLSMFDLRKLHGEPLYSGLAPMGPLMSSDAEDETEFDLWEKLTCDFDEDVWEDGNVSPNGDVVECQKGSSLLSWFASFIQGSLTSAS